MSTLPPSPKIVGIFNYTRPISAPCHGSATSKRDRAVTKALREACAGDREAVLAVKQLRRWLKRGGDLGAADLDAVRCLIERGIWQHAHVDTDQYDRLEDALARIGLRADAERLQIDADELAEQRLGT